MFSKLLIANRDEIAVRIAQTCREMGIDTVAVYSSADAEALHVQLADEAYCVGGPSPLESYLREDAILEAALRSGSEAVHPGYGFLAESPRFATAVQKAGLTWIGPPAEVIALMGDKVAAKQLAASAGVLVIPGYVGEDQDVDRMLKEAERIGYPVMIKAAAGGGGRGMRVVGGPEELPPALEGARREARGAFGDDRVFLEKVLPQPRHVEIQVLVDAFDTAVHLGERECSIQRRHQKVLEEAPSPILTRDLRAAMGEAALRIARAGGYRNAGTVEFLFSGDCYYFLEVNTRIQVEHPVTEMVTGLDLVRLQVDIAAGRPIPFSQLDVRLEGHAIEARLYTENAGAGFLPATGRLQVFRPPLGPGIRNDVGVEAGDEVHPYYDSMLAKLIVHATKRSEAVSRLEDALRRYEALGVTTNLEFLRWIASHPDFRAGRVDVNFVDRHWTPREEEPPIEALIAAAAFDLMSPEEPESAVGAHNDTHNPWRIIGGWRQGGIARQLVYRRGDRTYQVEVVRLGDGEFQFSHENAVRRVGVTITEPDTVMLQDEAHRLSFKVAQTGDETAVQRDGRVFRFQHTTLRGIGLSSSDGSVMEAGLSAPMPGTVVKVEVQPGQRVSRYEPLIVLEAMKMEHVVVAPHDGVVRDVFFHEGDMVPAGSPLLALETA